MTRPYPASLYRAGGMVARASTPFAHARDWAAFWLTVARNERLQAADNNAWEHKFNCHAAIARARECRIKAAGFRS
jgi:hypothetical protein